MTTYVAPREKLFGHLDRLVELRDTSATAAPINVEVDLSNRCSLGCEWCHFAYTHTRGPLAGKRRKPANAEVGGDLMDPLLAARLIGEAAKLGAASITWTGGGEPTLHPAFDEIVQTGEGRIAQGLYTHGGHISTERAALLKRVMTFVYVSLDAADAESYKRDKGVDRFDAACAGIRRLVAADGDATVGVGFLLGAHNWWKARQMADLGRSLGADYVQFRPIILYDIDDPGTVTDAQTEWLHQPLRELLDGLAAEPGVEIDVERFRMYRHWKGHGYETCWWSVLQTVVTPNGKMWRCVNKREQPAALLGDLSVESFADVWARVHAQPVDSDCRVLCRGHLANLALDDLLSPRVHPEFV